MFERENIMKSFSGDMILPKFGGYKYITKLEVTWTYFILDS